MGGSGTSYFPSMTPRERLERIRDEEERTKSQAFDARVSVELEKILSRIRPHDSDAVQGHLEEMKRTVAAELDGSVEALFGGSVAKHTYVHGLSDVDALLILNDATLTNSPPSEALLHFQRELQERFPKTAVSLGDISVRVGFGDVEVQVLPGVREGDKVRIPSSLGNRWISIEPKQFAKALTEVNQTQGGKVVPAIRLSKLVNSNLREDQRLSGYHLEALAVEAFSDYTGPQNTKAMLSHFFSQIPERLKTPLKDQTRQTAYVDGYLDDEGRRSTVVSAYERAARRFRNADGARSLEQWLKPLA